MQVRLRSVLAIPALESLLETGTHLVAKTEPHRQRVGSQVVVLQHAYDRTAPFPEEGDGETHQLRQRPAQPEMTDEVAGCAAGHGKSVGLEGDVVTKPLSLLVGVREAAHPGEQSGVIEDLPRRLVETEALTESQRDQALTQHVLHRLPQPQVGPQRQRRDQLGQSHRGSRIRVVHGASQR
jgi:hypothetical protein